MKKILTCLILSVCGAAFLFAYNPPVNGENFLELSSPKTLTEAASVTGGGLFYASPSSLIVNPALPAGEQRIELDLGYTALTSSNDANNAKFGSAFQLGMVFPTKWYVYSAYLNGTFVPFAEMDLGNSFNLKGSVSKEVTEKLDVGVGLDTGIIFGSGVDWNLAGSLGFVYKWGDLSFMKDFRFGASVLNLGKVYHKINLDGIYTSDENPKLCGLFPMIGTVKGGASTILLENSNFKIGASMDLTIPGFQNVIFDAGVKFSVKDMLVISVAEKINLRESIAGINNYIPSVGVFFNFTLDVKNVEYLERHSWSESEMNAQVAYKRMYSTVNAISAGVDLKLGMADNEAPKIELWLDEEVEDAE